MKTTFITLLLLSVFNMSLPSTGWSQSPEEWTLPSITDLNEPFWQEIVEYAQENVSLEGTLLKGNGFYIKLKVDKDYINVLFPLLGLEEKGFMKPKTSAHIGVIFDPEVRHRLSESRVEEETGQTFHFTLEGIHIIKIYPNPYHPVPWHHHAVLRVQSPELNALREKYGLTTRSDFFYITLAKRYY
jgi:hypothetical protein